MKKTYAVRVDITMSGTLYVEAASSAEAKTMAEEEQLVASDLHNFWHVSTEILDVEVDEG